MLTRCALLAALHCVCGWISVSIGDTVFTMQTFAVFLTLFLMGGKWGTATVLVYLLLGAVGLPVFSGFRGGVGMLFGATGGYLMGFVVTGLTCWAVEAVLGSRFAVAAMIFGLLGCYAYGTVWYLTFYAERSAFGPVLVKCVIPFVIPDALKMVLAYRVSRRIKGFRTV